MQQTKTILVVDDDQALRDGLQAVLQKHGFNTLEADDGLAARRLIDSHHPNLVLLDMMMPRWGGLAVLEHFHGKTGAPRFIMMTACDGAKHKAYAEKIGVVDYLVKPFSMERLLGGVTRLLGRASSAEETVSTIRCRCRACGARIRAARRLLGQSRPCPACRRSVLVEVEVNLPDDEGPMLLQSDWSDLT